MFELALKLGRSVEELLLTVSARELREWEAFYNLYPFDHERDVRRSAMLLAMYANCHRAEGVQPFTVDDFTLYPRHPKAEQTDDVEAQMLAFANNPKKLIRDE